MSYEKKTIRRSFSNLIDRGRVVDLVDFYRNNSSRIEPYAIAGYTWIQYAVEHGNLDIVEALVSLGFDVHALGQYGDDNTLTIASHRGDPNITEYLLSSGVEPFLAESVGNPLIACMPAAINDKHPSRGKDTPPENYLTIAKMLIDHGIDTTVRYDMSYGDQIDAMMYALIWQREDIAKLIAEHQADGDHDKAARLLQEAQVSIDALSSEGGSDEDE